MAGLRREVLEESGLQIEVGPVTTVGVEKFPPTVRIGFLGSVVGGSFRRSGEVSLCAYYPVNGLPKGLYEVHERMIRAAYQGWSELQQDHSLR